MLGLWDHFKASRSRKFRLHKNKFQSVMINKVYRKVVSFLRRIRIRRCIKQGMPVPFDFKGTKLFLNPENAAVYHIENSTKKIERMVNLIGTEPKVILDVGANCGIFSALAAARFPSAKIYAFEPSDDLIPLIRSNCQGHNVSIHQCAVGEKQGTMTLYVNSKSQQTNSLNMDAVKLFSPEEEIEKRSVECITLDEFAKQNYLAQIDVLKVDVQGFEGAVLRGGRETLRRTPLLFIESTWIDIESIVELLPLALHYGFRFAAVIAPVYMGADIMFSRTEIAESEHYLHTFELDAQIQSGRWL